MVVKERDIEEIRDTIGKVVIHLNELTDRFNKAKWIREMKNEIASSVYLQIKTDLEKLVKKGIEEGLEKIRLSVQNTENRTPVI